MYMYHCCKTPLVSHNQTIIAYSVLLCWLQITTKWEFRLYVRRELPDNIKVAKYDKAQVQWLCIDHLSTIEDFGSVFKDGHLTGVLLTAGSTIQSFYMHTVHVCTQVSVHSNWKHTRKSPEGDVFLWRKYTSSKLHVVTNFSEYQKWLTHSH